MQYYMAFHDGKVIRSSDTYQRVQGLPNGTYVLSNEHWYVVIAGQMVMTNKRDIPDYIRMYLLIL
jgi:hypothetical protein